MADDDRRRDASWGAGDFGELAQRYWGAWGEVMRNAAPGGADAQAGVQAWHDALDWWTRQVHGSRAGVNDTLERFNAQARGWFSQMQQVATRFAGQDGSAHDIAQAWKQALGASAGSPFPEMLRSMRGHGLQGLDQWIENASPYLGALRSEGLTWLRTPAFGFAREHQERLQALARAQVEYQERNSAYNALMAKAMQSAIEIFEDKLVEREEPGRQIESPRALFDLWIDAAEEAYAEIALSQEFREVYGQLVDAQMRLRAGIQREVEQACALFDMPTRTELDGAHRKIVELERAVRRLRDAGSAAAAAGSKAPASAGRAQAVARPANEDAGVTPAKAAEKAGAGTTGKAAGKKAAGKAGKKAAGRKAAKAAKQAGSAASARPARQAARPAARARLTALGSTAIPDAPGQAQDTTAAADEGKR